MTCNPTMYVGIVRKPGGNIFSCPDGCHMARTEIHGKSRVVRPNLAFARCVQSRSEHIYEPTPGAKTKTIHHLLRTKFNVRQMRHLTVSLRRSSPITSYNL